MVIQATASKVVDIINDKTNKTGSSRCTKCKNALAAAKNAALFAPSSVPDAMVTLCKDFRFASNSTCEEKFTASTFGAVWTQVLAYADLQGLDGEYICWSLSKSFCSEPNTTPLDTASLFPKPKPADAYARVPKPSGNRVKVLHLSDFHLDPRYAVNSEANCSSGMCCRSNTFNSGAVARGLYDDVLLPAPAYGSFLCDTPYDLALAALQAVGPLTGTGTGKGQDSLAWTIYTGDLVSHDRETEASRAYTEYTETSVYEMFKKYLTGPVFAALGNHDTNPANVESPHSLPGRLRQQHSWNHEHVSGLWLHEGWISPRAAEDSRMHYGGYSMKTQFGLRIIAFNTDFWYKTNYLNFINTTNPDTSGTFAWMISELQKAEDARERVWIIGHVPSGWDGTNALPNPSNLFYQIVDRYSPHVIASIFFGHTHEDHLTLFYAHNATAINASTALTPAWVGPSITPLTNMNSAFRLYEVDSADFNVYNAYTYFSNVSDFAGLNASLSGPTYRFEYSARALYAPAIAGGWPRDASLNATFWHLVTEAMERDAGLVRVQNRLQGKLSVKSPECVGEVCQRAKVCYMRSGSVALGRGCVQGFGSVQSGFK